MNNLLLSIIAINLIFISANLALRSVGAVHAQASAADLNEIADDTTGVITATVGDGEDSDEGEESSEAEDLNDLNSKTDVVITGGEDHPPDGA